MEYLLYGLRTGRYRAGEQIIPEAVAEEVGVSHVPVREAVRKLEGRGTLTHRPRRGYFVAELDVDDLDTIVVLGSLLENEALRRVLPVITADQIERMRKAIENSRALQGRDPVGVVSANRVYHEVMFERGVPKLLLRHLSMLWSTMEPYRPLLYSAEQNQNSSCLEHEAILAAIERRDIDAAVAAYDEHRVNVFRAMRDLIPQKDPETG
ncbi:GntR family transcriptional regulator [Actinomadura macra]|uniref:GntR family transcriptional regulator n=1 Tax=Actinomadura macra TaxID=46164 RepID=UPI0008352611|nr:GntR family transcriptional regulator [Actinomadura macra]